MAEDKLGVRQRAVLLVLMVTARAVSNNELDELCGLRLDGKERQQLNARGLVASTRVSGNRPYVHELTESGWRWCRTELTAPRPATSRDSLVKALYVLLGGLDGYLDRAELGLADLFDVPAATSVADRIRAAYHALATRPGDYVSLTDLRRNLDGAPRAEVDAALLELNRTRQVILVADDAQESLSAADRAAALRIGNQDNHLLAIESA